MLLRLHHHCLHRCNILKYLKPNIQPSSCITFNHNGMCQPPIRLCSKGSQSWVQLLYDKEDKHGGSLLRLRRKLDVALTSTRSHEKGDLLPYLVAQELVKFYESQVDLEEKAILFQHLAHKLGVDFNAVLANIRKCEDVIPNERLQSRYQQTLVNSLTPTYKHLFDDISKLQLGTTFLVNMRKDLLACFRGKHLTKTLALKNFDSCLKEHLARWFANGFLDLEVVSWGETSGQFLEKVMNYEAVHVMKDWSDLKSRASKGRRIFIFSHRLMPDEPLVILHTLLGNEIPNSIQAVLSTPIRDENKADITTATFYSVTSTQRGLDGIGLGNLLIKRVVEKLKNEFHQLSTFITLSPIPGFKKWLDIQLTSAEILEEIPSHFSHIFSNDREKFVKFRNYLSTPNWHLDQDVCGFLREPLTKLCVEYLFHTKRRGFAINPVAHFHLRNGACLWKINWLGNTNDYGIKSSYGFMANYKYELSELEQNNNNYVQSGKIAVSSHVLKYLCN